MSSKLKILFVDNDQLTFERLKTMSAALNIDLVHTKNSDAAVQALSKSLFHLALIDTNLQNQNSYETLQLIKKNQPSLFVAMVANGASDPIFSKALSSGAMIGLIRPIAVADMIFLVQKAEANRFYYSELEKLLQDEKKCKDEEKDKIHSKILRLQDVIKELETMSISRANAA